MKLNLKLKIYNYRLISDSDDLMSNIETTTAPTGLAPTPALEPAATSDPVDLPVDQDLFRLTIILAVLLLVFYTLSGHFIEKFRVSQEMHNST